MWKKENIGKEEHEIVYECIKCHEDVMYDVESGFVDCDGRFMTVICAKCGHSDVIRDI